MEDLLRAIPEATVRSIRQKNCLLRLAFREFMPIIKLKATQIQQEHKDKGAKSAGQYNERNFEACLYGFSDVRASFLPVYILTF